MYTYLALKCKTERLQSVYCDNLFKAPGTVYAFVSVIFPSLSVCVCLCVNFHPRLFFPLVIRESRSVGGKWRERAREALM